MLPGCGLLWRARSSMGKIIFIPFTARRFHGTLSTFLASSLGSARYDRRACFGNLRRQADLGLPVDAGAVRDAGGPLGKTCTGNGIYYPQQVKRKRYHCGERCDKMFLTDDPKRGRKKMARKFFSDEIDPACRYCAVGTPNINENYVLCPKRGVMEAASSCASFRYDPLRRPVSRRPMTGTEELKPEDFTL